MDREPIDERIIREEDLVNFVFSIGCPNCLAKNEIRLEKHLNLIQVMLCIYCNQPLFVCFPVDDVEEDE